MRSVEFGEHCYRPTADNPFPFTTSQLARLEVQASRVDTLRLAYRHGQEMFRARHFLPTSEPGLDAECWECAQDRKGGPSFPPAMHHCNAVTNTPPLSDTAAGMLGRLDSLSVSDCYGCERERAWHHPVAYTLHVRSCPKSRP